MPENENDLPADRSLRPLVWLCLIVVGVWAAAGVTTFLALDTWSNRGTFGDMFGAVNALFSSLAFAGIIYTILIQRRELSLSLLEFRRTADAQEKARMASLLMQVYEFMYALRPKWLRLYELYSEEPAWRKWSEQDQQIGEEVGTQLQRVAYLCEKGLIDPVLIRDNWGIVFVKCWDILRGQIEDYRKTWAPRKKPYDPRPPRADFEVVAAKFRSFYEKPAGPGGAPQGDAPTGASRSR